MGFFDDVPPPPEPAEPAPYVYRPWMGPPQGWAGGWVPWNLVLFRTPDLHATLSRVVAYPEGVSLGIGVRSRPRSDEDPFGPFSLHHRLMSGPDGPRLGIGFADGRKAVTGRFPWSQDEPDAPVLIPGGGGGGGDEGFHMGMWLWPLPPPGPLQIAVSWPAEGVDEVTHELDATDLVDAAGRAEKLWDYDANEVSRGRRGVRTSRIIRLHSDEAEDPDEAEPDEPRT